VKNSWFFFGDYQGTRSNVGGSKVLTVPTAAARNGDFGAYGVNIFDPSGGAPGSRAQFPERHPRQPPLSPGPRDPRAHPPAQRARQRERDADNYIAQGSEKFNNDSANVRLDGRLSSSVNTFIRYSYARFDLNGPQAFGPVAARSW